MSWEGIPGYFSDSRNLLSKHLLDKCLARKMCHYIRVKQWCDIRSHEDWEIYFLFLDLNIDWNAPGHIFSHPVSSVLSNSRFWQKVIWGKKKGAILASEWTLNLYHHLIWSHSCYKWKAVISSKTLHVLLTACSIFLFLFEVMSF